MTTSSEAQSHRLRPDIPSVKTLAGPATLLHSGTHIGALDGIRGIAIILVLLFHYGRSARGFGFQNPILSACEFGWIGVDLFFVLSGFLITGILYESRETPRYFRNFYARRALRIFPLYYLALAFVVLLSLAWPAAGVWGTWSPLWIAFYLSNFAMAIGGSEATGILSHFWSLAIEEHFYLIWPFIVLWGTRKQLMCVAAGIIVFSFILRVVLVFNFENAGVYFITPTRFDTLAMGALCSLAIRGPGGAAGVARPAWGAMLGCGAALLALIIIRGRYDIYDCVMQTIGFTLLAATFGGTIIVALLSRPLSIVLNNRILRWFGRYSYGIYVWHVIVNVLLFYTPINDALGIEGRNKHILYLLFAFALVLLVSYTSYNLWEKRFLKLKSHFA